VLVSVLATASWLAFALANGWSDCPDSGGYLQVAEALRRLDFVTATSNRMPGYPLFLNAAHGLGALVGVDPIHVAIFLQVVLVAGVGTWLVYDLTLHLSGHAGVATLAAGLFAADVDVQNLATTILTEPLSIVLVLVFLWLRIRDGGWRRARWGLAALPLVRPSFAIFPVAFAALELARHRRLASAAGLLWPAGVVAGAWLAVSVASGADPITPHRAVGAFHTFGKLYVAGLFEHLPPGRDRTVLVRQRAAGHDAYRALRVLLGGTSHFFPEWKHLRRINRRAIKADPAGYLWACLAAVPPAFTQPSWYASLQLDGLNAWRAIYRATFYGSFVLFGVLLGLVAWNGLGWPRAREPARHVLVPYVAVLLVSTAFASLADYELGRLAITVHPPTAMIWALALGHLARA
jgi:hypothetical protein